MFARIHRNLHPHPRNPQFRCGRRANCSFEVYMVSSRIQPQSQGPAKTPNSVADVSQNAHRKFTWDLQGCWDASCSHQGWFQGGPEAQFGVPDVCLGVQDAARCHQDGLKLDSTCHLELSECFRNGHRCQTGHQNLSKCHQDVPWKPSGCCLDVL